MEKLFQKSIMALVPEYNENNCNYTILHRKNEEILILDKSIKTVIKLLAKYHMIDLNAMNKKYRNLISSKILTPISLSKDDILIPFKTRKEPYKNDGAFSYINMKYIKKIKKDNKSTIILLDNGVEIKCYTSLNTANKHLKNGKIINKCYEENIMKIKEQESSYNNLIPASKADIEKINKKLEAIIRMGSIK